MARECTSLRLPPEVRRAYAELAHKYRLKSGTTFIRRLLVGHVKEAEVLYRRIVSREQQARARLIAQLGEVFVAIYDRVRAGKSVSGEDMRWILTRPRAQQDRMLEFLRTAVSNPDPLLPAMDGPVPVGPAAQESA